MKRTKALPRYFIDLRNKDGMAPDEEGTEFLHLEDALTEAKDSARDLVWHSWMTHPSRGDPRALGIGSR